MKRYQTWRYKCDFCGKANCSGSAIAKHELHCTKNPNRVCRMCAAVGDKQAPMADLIAAIKYGDRPGYEAFTLGDSGEGVPKEIERKIDILRIVAHNCPACILSTLRQATEPEADAICVNDDGFSWKKERQAWIDDYHEASPIDMSSDPVFDREAWDEIRAKRFSPKTTVTP